MLSRCVGSAACLTLVLNTAYAADVILNGHTFTLPEGLEITVAANRPVTERPIHIDFDHKGRLYVAESSGSNENVREQLKKKPHSILRLEDSDGDGVFDKRTVFADRMMFPEGMLWYDGSIYVGAPPQIWKLTDTNDDGVADERVVWFDAKTLNGCANDLHGPYLGLDGWIYWCKGAFEQQTYERPGRKPLVTRASHMFRRRPEGGVVESVMTGGMDNPVEVAFSRGGERFFTTTFLEHPRDGKRDGIIHAIYGGVYGKDHGVLAGHPRTGELMPVLSHFGAAAPCGLTRVRSRHLGDAYRDNLLACQFNMHKVSRHVLVPRAGSFTTVDSDLLRSDNLDFHPTDVLEDADGSLLVVDTGGWYKLCCPTSQLYKPDIPGAIYRIRRKTAAAAANTRGQDIAWSDLTPEKLATLACDPRHAVRDRARTVIYKRGAEVVPSLRTHLQSQDADIRINAVWALTRISDIEARSAVRDALIDSHQTVRQAAIHSISVWQDRAAVPLLLNVLAGPSRPNQRAAAEALGRMRKSESVVEALLTAAATADDRATEHSLIFALMEIADPQATARGLRNPHPRTQRAALMAIDQMDGGGLTPGQLVGHLTNGDPILQETAWWIVQRHPEWAADLAAWFRDELLGSQTIPAGRTRASLRLTSFAGNSAMQAIMADALKSTKTGIVVKQNVLKAMASARPATLPDSWAVELTRLLTEKDNTLLGQTVSTCSALVSTKLNMTLVASLLKVSGDEGQPRVLRIQALATVCQANAKAGRRTQLDQQLMTYVVGSLSNTNPVRLRSLAVDVLTTVNLSPRDREQIATTFNAVSPTELKRLLSIYDGQKQHGLALVKALENAPATAALDPEALRQRFASLGDDVLRASVPLLQRLAKQTKQKFARIEAALSCMDKADERRGQKIFHGTKTACIACHQMGYVGGRIGPGLNGIGKIRTERDLLESILFPSSSFVRSFEPVQVLTHAGLVYNGLVREETDRELVLALDAQKVIRIAHKDIAERRDSPVSIMPAGLDKTLSDQDLADLIHFLKVQR